MPLPPTSPANESKVGPVRKTEPVPMLSHLDSLSPELRILILTVQHVCQGSREARFWHFFRSRVPFLCPNSSGRSIYDKCLSIFVSHFPRSGVISTKNDRDNTRKLCRMLVLSAGEERVSLKRNGRSFFCLPRCIF